ncbi:MAG: hypothetical protein HN392_13470 [Anaerolineae bacterium]|jgi:hypothetical protein|nr:hypothetical protein [Anaerolineae bacterium]MBT7783866.1 hypothetical protein [Anaerolineae bacterium]
MKKTPTLLDKEELIIWLLEGDVSIQYQVYRDLLGIEKPELQERIASEGWGEKFLSFRKAEGHWGQGFYQPKWISSHYSLLDLKYLNISQDIPEIQESIIQISQNHKSDDGGINPHRDYRGNPDSDLCINGMFLNYACYFRINEDELSSVVDCIIQHQMLDGGFNCRSNQGGAVHSSLHTTISILEGLWEYKKNGYTYRATELEKIAAEAREFILMHRLYKSDHTGEIINKKFLMLSYPSRWFYNILRALVYFQDAGVAYDPRMQDALDILMKKRRKDGTWPVQAKHAGKVHFDMEQTGQPSRWNTLRALRVVKHFEK